MNSFIFLLLCTLYQTTLLTHDYLFSSTLCSALSSGDMDDWDQTEVLSGHAGVQSVQYLNEEEEEEEEDGEVVELGQEVRKVTVRKSQTQHSCVNCHYTYSTYKLYVLQIHLHVVVKQL